MLYAGNPEYSTVPKCNNLIDADNPPERLQRLKNPQRLYALPPPYLLNGLYRGEDRVWPGWRHPEVNRNDLPADYYQ